MATESTRPPLSIPKILCLLLAVGWGYEHWRSSQRVERSTAEIRQVSNSWQRVSQKLEEQQRVNARLEQDLAALSKPRPTELQPVKPVSQTVASTAGQKISLPDPRVQQLEDEREELGGQITNLTTSLCELQSQIVETQRRLDASEGDRQELLQQMKRLQAQKTKLEERFNNLAALREQIHKLREEQTVSRRLAWIRRGLYGEPKGSELLRKAVASAPPASGHYDLDVELRQSPH